MKPTEGQTAACALPGHTSQSLHQTCTFGRWTHVTALRCTCSLSSRAPWEPVGIPEWHIPLKPSLPGVGIHSPCTAMPWRPAFLLRRGHWDTHFAPFTSGHCVRGGKTKLFAYEICGYFPSCSETGIEWGTGRGKTWPKPGWLDGSWQNSLSQWKKKKEKKRGKD